jgi:glyceraldehyde 3-phosphate dehydrogenase
MEYRVAINGFGRIGRNYVRCLLERGLQERGINVAGINDLWDPGTLAHLLQNDTTFGRLRWDVDHDDANLHVGGQSPVMSSVTSHRVSSMRASLRPTVR